MSELAGAVAGYTGDGEPPRTSAARDPAVVYLAAFVVVGLALTLSGPAIGLLKAQVGAGTGAIGVVFTAQGAGYLVGALVLGHGYDRGSGNRLMALSLVAVAVGTLCLPLPDELLLLCLTFAAVGVAAAVVDVGGNTLLGWSRGGGAAPWLAALHFCFGLGALASPLVVAASDHLSDGIGPAAVAVAVTSVAVAAWVFPLPTPPRPEPAAVSHDRTAAERGTMLVSIFLFLYVGVEVGFAGWIHTYAEELDFGATGATALTAAFWAAFTVGRLVSVPVAQRWPSRGILTSSCVLTVVAAGILAFGGLAVDGAPTGVAWPATILLGLAVAPQFPMAIAFAGEHLRVTASTMSKFVAAAGIGTLVLPWTIGAVLDAQGARAMPVAVFAGALAALGWWLFTARVLAPQQPLELGTASAGARDNSAA
jgi:FHS family Na+ dependent glucose MFS transporter 1